MRTNHLIDPTYFYDVIEEFAFDYKIYVLSEKTLNKYGEISYGYEVKDIRGSLQTQGTSLNQDSKGNTRTSNYNFYCKSLYRINIGDVIDYNGKYLRVDSFHDYDEFGVRSCSLSMINLVDNQSLSDYIKYISREKRV